MKSVFLCTTTKHHVETDLVSVALLKIGTYEAL